MIFSLVIDRIIKKRIQLSLGQKQYDYKNHVIVCGLGRLGYCIVEELIKAGEKVIVVQNNADSDKADELRLRGVDVYVGNARSFAVLQDVNVINARGLISVIDNDYLNLEIGLNARSIRSDLPLVLRIVDEEMAVQLREDLDIHLTLSMSDLADDRFMSLLKNKTD
jgi:voltage-gated potassium channel Kch